MKKELENIEALEESKKAKSWRDLKAKFK